MTHAELQRQIKKKLTEIDELLIAGNHMAYLLTRNAPVTIMESIPVRKSWDELVVKHIN